MLDLLSDLWAFMRERKKFWLAPIIVVMVLLGVSIDYEIGEFDTIALSMRFGFGNLSW